MAPASTRKEHPHATQHRRGPGNHGVPVRHHRRVLALGRSVRGGRHRFDLADRPIDQPRPDPGKHERPGRDRRPHAPHQVRRQRSVRGDARTGAAGETMRHDRHAVGRQAAARLRHRQPARAGMAGDAPRSHHARPQDRRGAGNHCPALDRRKAGLRGQALPPDRCADRSAAGTTRSADVDWRLVRCGGAANRAVWHRLAGGRRAGRGSGPGDRLDPRRGGGSRPAYRRRSLRCRLCVPLRHLGRPGHGPRGRRLPRPHRPRSARGVRGGRRDDDHDADCGVRGRRRVEVHPAPGRSGRRRHAGADAAADRGSVAARFPRVGRAR